MLAFGLRALHCFPRMESFHSGTLWRCVSHSQLLGHAVMARAAFRFHACEPRAPSGDCYTIRALILFFELLHCSYHRSACRSPSLLFNPWSFHSLLCSSLASFVRLDRTKFTPPHLSSKRLGHHTKLQYHCCLPSVESDSVQLDARGYGKLTHLLVR